MHLLKVLPKMVVFFIFMGCSFAWGQVEVKNDNSFKIKSNSNDDNTVYMLDGSLWINSNRSVKIGQDGNKMWLGWGQITMNPGSDVYSQIEIDEERVSNCFKLPSGKELCVKSWRPVIEPSHSGYLGRSGKRWSEIHGYEVYANEFITTSDGEYKTQIDSLNGDESISTIQALNPVKYKFNEAYWNDYGYDSVEVFPQDKKYRDRWGFIAQEVNQVMPELANPIDSTGTMGLNQTELIPILTNAIQKQQKQIENLQQQLNNLQDQVDGCCPEPE